MGSNNFIIHHAKDWISSLYSLTPPSLPPSITTWTTCQTPGLKLLVQQSLARYHLEAPRFWHTTSRKSKPLWKRGTEKGQRERLQRLANCTSCETDFILLRYVRGGRESTNFAAPRCAVQFHDRSPSPCRYLSPSGSPSPEPSSRALSPSRSRSKHQTASVPHLRFCSPTLGEAEITGSENQALGLY